MKHNNTLDDSNRQHNDGGGNLVHFAVAGNNDLKIISILDKPGINVNNMRDNNNGTPLHWAAGNNRNPKMTSGLISIGADVNARDNNDGTPLHWATLLNGNPEVIKTLLEKGSDPKAKDASGKTAYDLIQGNEELKDDPIAEKLRVATN